jgi:hypothetical protein
MRGQGCEAFLNPSTLFGSVTAGASQLIIKFIQNIIIMTGCFHMLAQKTNEAIMLAQKANEAIAGLKFLRPQKTIRSGADFRFGSATPDALPDWASSRPAHCSLFWPTTSYRTKFDPY